MEAIEPHDADSLSLPFRSSAMGRLHFRSEPGSPSGSYPAAQETEEDDDEYIAELTRRMANDMLQDDDKHEKSWGGSGSPQSTLWSPFGFGSVGSSREASPPLTPATENFEKMKANDEMNPLLIPFPSKEALIDIQIRSAQANFRKTKEEKQKKEKQEQRSRNDAVYGNRVRATTRHYGGKSSGNHQRNGSGTKAVFLDGSGSRPVTGGTGVFLPRGTGTGTVMESRKKTGCSTVIIPARVVEALKLHFDKMGLPSKFTSALPLPPRHHDALLISMNENNNKTNKNILHRAKKSYAEVVSACSHRGTPLDLPPEWTY